MTYEITIKRMDTKPVTKRGEHTVVSEQPWDDASLCVASGYGDTRAFLDRCPVQKIYGYAPSYESAETVETEILKQTVEELDLAAVIKAINNL